MLPLYYYLLAYLLGIVAPEAAGRHPRAGRAERVEGKLNAHGAEVGQHEAVRKRGGGVVQAARTEGSARRPAAHQPEVGGVERPLIHEAATRAKEPGGSQLLVHLVRVEAKARAGVRVRVRVRLGSAAACAPYGPPSIARRPARRASSYPSQRARTRPPAPLRAGAWSSSTPPRRHHSRTAQVSRSSSCCTGSR